jgi:hypothetical protein
MKHSTDSQDQYATAEAPDPKASCYRLFILDPAWSVPGNKAHIALDPDEIANCEQKDCAEGWNYKAHTSHSMFTLLLD